MKRGWCRGFAPRISCAQVLVFDSPRESNDIAPRARVLPVPGEWSARICLIFRSLMLWLLL